MRFRITDESWIVDIGKHLSPVLAHGLKLRAGRRKRPTLYVMFKLLCFCSRPSSKLADNSAPAYAGRPCATGSRQGSRKVTRRAGAQRRSRRRRLDLRDVVVELGGAGRHPPHAPEEAKEKPRSLRFYQLWRTARHK